MTQTAMSFRPDFFTLARIPLGLALLLGACQGSHPLTTAPETPTDPEVESNPESLPQPPALDTPSLSELQELAQQDPAAALNELDRLAHRQGELTSGQCLVYAQATMRLFDRKMADGSLSPTLAEDLLFDAEAAYDRWLTLDGSDVDGLLGLLHCLRQAGKPAQAWAAAEVLYGLLEPDLQAGRRVGTAPLLAVGQAGLDWTIARVQAQQGAPAGAYLAVVALDAAVDAGSEEAFLPLADLYAWSQEPELAMKTLADGLQARPDDLVLYGRMQNLGGSHRRLQGDLLEQVRETHPDRATPLWYLGEARYWQGREARHGADYLKALDCWDLAEDAFKQAMAIEGNYRATCEEWLFQVRTQRGWTLRDEGRRGDAAASFLDTLTGSPQQLEPESSPESLHLGIDAIVADFYRDGDLKSARSFLLDVCSVRDDDPNWTNNLGFFCRDLGVQAVRNEHPDLARQYFEESWAAYCRTVELSPDEPRLVNDRALIAVYYLDEHWDLAEQELHRAIALGTEAIAELPEDVPEEEHQYLDMAIGDAWENLAYLYLMRRGEIGQSETYIRNSLNHFPFRDRDGIPPLQARLEELRKQR